MPAGDARPGRAGAGRRSRGARPRSSMSSRGECVEPSMRSAWSRAERAEYPASSTNGRQTISLRSCVHADSSSRRRCCRFEARSRVQAELSSSSLPVTPAPSWPSPRLLPRGRRARHPNGCDRQGCGAARRRSRAWHVARPPWPPRRARRARRARRDRSRARARSSSSAACTGGVSVMAWRRRVVGMRRRVTPV